MNSNPLATSPRTGRSAQEKLTVIGKQLLAIENTDKPEHFYQATKPVSAFDRTGFKIRDYHSRKNELDLLNIINALDRKLASKILR